MIVGSWTDCYTTTSEVKSVGWTYTVFISEEKSPVILPGLRLIDTSITDLSYFVSSLLIYCSPRPKLIQNYSVRRFKVQENSWLEAPGSKGDVGEDSGRESIFGEIIDEGVIEFEVGIRVAYRESRVIDLQDIKLSKEGRILPIPLIDNGP